MNQPRTDVPEERHQARHLFGRALQLPPHERSSFLEKQCRGDHRLRRMVESLIGHDDSAGDFLTTPLVDLLLPQLSERSVDWVGQAFGPYRIIETIGQGGMSTVLLACRDDAAYEQEVAIKVIRRGLEGAEVARRFRDERQILARLKHPSIARLIDGGTTTDGFPYLVMDYVDGRPITEYCDAERLTIQERLTLFRRVCSTVNYAHQNLVVHRDLKPGNILVTAAGDPYLLDFGIAKVIDQSLRMGAGETAPHVRIFTPNYCSPEQASGRPISTASDSYSLGILLYELLTGQLPFDWSLHTLLERVEITNSTRPTLPSLIFDGHRPIYDGPPVDIEGAARNRRLRRDAVSRRLAGDLDSIVLKALQPEVDHRYVSVHELIADIDRFFAGRPVRARPNSWWYRGHRFVRRNVTLVTALAVTTVSIFAFAVLAILHSVRLAEEQEETRVERNRAEQVTRFLAESFALADPEASGGEDVTALMILEKSSQRIEELEDSPELQSALQHTIGTVYVQLGRWDEGLAFLEASVATRRRLEGSELELAASLEALSYVHSQKSELETAEVLARESLDLRRALLGGEHLDVAKSLHRLTSTYRAQGRIDEAESLAYELLELRRTVPDTIDREAATLVLIASLKKHRGEYAAAEDYIREAMSLSQGTNSRRYTAHLSELAKIQYHQGLYRGAATTAAESVTINRELYGQDHPRVLKALNILATMYFLAGQYAEAEPIYRQAIPVAEQQYGVEHPEFSYLLGNFSVLLLKLNRLEEAEELSRRSLAIRRTALPDRHRNKSGALLELATLLRTRGELVEAETRILEALELNRTHRSESHPQFANCLVELAELRLAQGDLLDAESHLIQALEVQEAKFGLEHPDVVATNLGLARVRIAQEDVAAAEALLRSSLVVRQKLLGPDHPELIEPHLLMADVSIATERLDLAKEHASRGLELAEEFLPVEHPSRLRAVERVRALG